MQADITIPYAIADFAELREQGYYYVDKTKYIVSLERYKAPVFLRPRRFGKSLWVSTLAYYYDINAADRFDTLFGGTYIGAHPTSQHNRYMVLQFDFSVLQPSNNTEELKENFNERICRTLKNFVRAKTLYARFFEDFSFSNEHKASTMLEDILEHIRGYDLPRLYILIDEYDNFTNQLLTTYQDTLYETVTTGDSFLCSFFKVIKSGLGRSTIRTCFCTGVLPVTMDDLTSGYNVAQILTLEPSFLEMLGFNHEEASTYLRYVIDKYGEEKGIFDEIWRPILNNYDGYRFLPGANPIFNPTVLSYFFQQFAVNHGSNPYVMNDDHLHIDINRIRRLMQIMENGKEIIDSLVMDNKLPYCIADLHHTFDNENLFNRKFYPAILYYLGVTTLKDEMSMCLPNLIMRRIFIGYFNERYKR
ncbi:MAG: AAA family ATPase [Prevotellaceae bacterium]|jgi:hypothetical protein|nr:AAA family ATPase [Prevotellaceae bacterium]